jgi:hypothetical protein
MPQMTLNRVERACDVVKWFYQMVGIDVDLRTRQDDIIYVSMLFKRRSNVSNETKQAFAHALYLAYLENGMTTCRFFKSVDRALNFREMILGSQHKKEVARQEEKGKTINLKRQQRLVLKNRLEDRTI